MRERAALGVLAGQADRDPLDEQAGEGELLGLAPVDAALVERVAPALELLRELRVDGEALGHARAARRSARAAARPGTAVTTSAPGRGRDAALVGDRGHALAEASSSAARAPPSASCRRASAIASSVLLRDDALARRAPARTARARSAAARSARPSAAACTRPRPARCGRGGGSRRGRSRRRCRSGGGSAIASRTAESAASGSSALTWMIGRSKPLARSLE